MRIDPKELIADLPSMKIRNIIKQLRRGNRSTGNDRVLEILKTKLNISLEQASKTIEELNRLGYIEYHKHHDFIFWTVTDEGLRLSLASAAKPVSRATADKILKEFLERVTKINEDPHYLCCVTKVVIFGSYLTRCPTLNDVDIAVNIQYKNVNGNIIEFTDKAYKHAEEETKKTGRQFGTWFDMIFWPNTEVRLFLKNRSRTISLHSTSDGVLKRTKTKVIYDRINR